MSYWEDETAEVFYTESTVFKYYRKADVLQVGIRNKRYTDEVRVMKNVGIKLFEIRNDADALNCLGRILGFLPEGVNT